MVRSFDKYHHLFNLHILVTIRFFMIEILVYWRYFKGYLTNKIFTKKQTQK